VKVRQLEAKDAELMKEWMNDPELNYWFRFHGKKVTTENVLDYILNSMTDINKHYAIVDEKDTYLGTISLKNIDYLNSNAEYAISLRKCIIGTGVAKLATIEILKVAFEKLNLKKVYLNVREDNIRAIKFYEKMGFIYEGEFKAHIFHEGEYKNLKWYAIFRNCLNENQK
jgi:diamine N-acetyltransferase